MFGRGLFVTWVVEDGVFVFLEWFYIATHGLLM